MVPKGQLLMQTAQPWQRLVSILATVSMVMASSGHASTQAPQPLQVLSSTTATIESLSLRFISRVCSLPRFLKAVLPISGDILGAMKRLACLIGCMPGNDRPLPNSLGPFIWPLPPEAGLFLLGIFDAPSFIGRLPTDYTLYFVPSLI